MPPRLPEGLAVQLSGRTRITVVQGKPRMKGKRRASSVLAACLLLGCSKSSNLDAPRDFFAENKIGNSADYGIFKGYANDDHVVSVHGFWDDLDVCLQLVEKLNEKEPGTFRCAPLNH
jgi:hypothetical protein